jgi:hypothetical protein
MQLVAEDDIPKNADQGGPFVSLPIHVEEVDEENIGRVLEMAPRLLTDDLPREGLRLRRRGRHPITVSEWARICTT